MNMLEIINNLFEKSDWSKARVARELGMYSQRFNGLLHRNRSMKVNNAVEILNIIGYDVVVVPKGTKCPQGSIVVTPEDNDISERNAPVGRPRKQSE